MYNSYTLPSTSKTAINPLTRSLTSNPSDIFHRISALPQIPSTVIAAINTKQSREFTLQSKLSPEDVVSKDTRNVGIFTNTNTRSIQLSRLYI